jgi:hypothetical protein
MNNFLRNYATPLSMAAFLGVGVSGVMLFLGVRNHSLSEIHEWIGVLFVVAGIMHFIRNWQGIKAMLLKTQGKIFTGLGVIAVVAMLFASFGGDGGRHGGGPGGGHYGPMGTTVSRLAQAPISKLAPALGLTSEEAIARLRKSGVAVAGPGQSLNEISASQHAPLPRLMNTLAAEEDDA